MVGEGSIGIKESELGSVKVVSKDCEIGKISLGDSNYPHLLKKIPNPPSPLYFLGNFSEEIFENTLAVVGSRAITSYGEWVVNNLVKEIARYGITIVSGFMYGVDALAHKVSLEVGGHTIAVMAGGINCIVPSYQKDLFLEIKKFGLVVSEFNEQNLSGRWMFARRNRIVAGLSKAVLVVEAGEKSGSLITANFAKEYKRQVFVVPANLNSPNFVGIAKLIGEGAVVVTEPWDILKIFFKSRSDLIDKTSKNRDMSLGVNIGVNHSEDMQNAGGTKSASPDVAGNTRLITEMDKKIYKALRFEPLSLDLLVNKTKLEVPQVLQSITNLLLRGLIIERGGKYYVN